MVTAILELYTYMLSFSRLKGLGHKDLALLDIPTKLFQLITVFMAVFTIVSRLIQAACMTSLGCLCLKRASCEIFGCKYVCISPNLP